MIWVGLRSQRGSKASADSAYLNELYRSRGEGVYVDVWGPSLMMPASSRRKDQTTRGGLADCAPAMASTSLSSSPILGPGRGRAHSNGCARPLGLHRGVVTSLRRASPALHREWSRMRPRSAPSTASVPRCSPRRRRTTLVACHQTCLYRIATYGENDGDRRSRCHRHQRR